MKKYKSLLFVLGILVIMVVFHFVVQFNGVDGTTLLSYVLSIALWSDLWKKIFQTA